MCHETVCDSSPGAKSVQFYLNVVGCYRTPSADSSVLSVLTQLLSNLNSRELVLGDFNINWLHSVFEEFKAYCDSLNTFQLAAAPTCPNSKSPEKSSLIDWILTNVPQVFSCLNVWHQWPLCHCNNEERKNPKNKTCIIVKHDMKHFSKQGFFNDLYNFEWDKHFLISDFFYEGSNNSINKHAPLKKVPSERPE